MCDSSGVLCGFGLRQVKLADFGFARTYLSEDEKTKMIMTSLAGTPVFMVCFYCVVCPFDLFV